MSKIIELIYTEDHRGAGTEADPARLIKQLWTKDGNLAVEVDPVGQSTVNPQFI